MRRLPFVTAICPTTAARLKYLPRAIRCFLDQTYSNSELLILEDAGQSVRAAVPDHNRIRYATVARCRSLGIKRNVAAQMARGSLICHWDDDDWSAPGRIAEQVRMINESGAAVVGFQRLLFWDEKADEAMLYEGSSLYAPGSTLMYRRDWWQGHQFESLQVGEDNLFVSAALKARMFAAAEGAGLMVATTHTGNTSPRDSRSTRQWKRVTKNDIPRGYFQ